jgi:outer membrane protein TolC
MPKKTGSKQPANSRLAAKGRRSGDHIRQVTAERDQLKKQLAAAQEELTDYRRAMHALMRERVTDEQLERVADEETEPGISIVQLIEQVEQRRGK